LENSFELKLNSQLSFNETLSLIVYLHLVIIVYLHLVFNIVPPITFLLGEKHCTVAVYADTKDNHLD